jgi:hypothetical protein
MTKTMSHVPLAAQQAEHRVRVVKRLVQEVQHPERVLLVLLLPKRKKKKTRVGLWSNAWTMMGLSGLRVKTEHGTIVNQDKAIGSNGRIR